MGLFITFEGPEGSGKTTVLRAVAAELEKVHDVVTTREPGGVETAEAIRNILLDGEGMDGRTEALLFAAARREHLVQKVLPALEANCIVLCDRFVDSSLAYQGYARQIGVEGVQRINDFAVEDHHPDMTIYLDIPAELGRERIAINQREQNRLDKEDIVFHDAVIAGYKELIAQNPGRFAVIDASCSVDEVVADVVSVVRQQIEKKSIEN
ncbi:dTMP kinase [Staphylococcus muscae]|uniref:Thymidylate kinase n=1 Tax=Staphylococcus muscae TaxID=1294 RepID=A0A240BSK0_9STAP|nr:dTMP kinase [Staphylococcus muscae]AVQ34072.1 dTMP kinase [Staphylococcus muscae]PNZ01089.1 dTMP kinase [Staphylococcus muscae]GGA95111.1 thymidylate kinase [Staphylococcus muscae]SNV98684.1 thymidylate kinase [Staphylococcus muscae]